MLGGWSIPSAGVGGVFLVLGWVELGVFLVLRWVEYS